MFKVGDLLKLKPGMSTDKQIYKVIEITPKVYVLRGTTTKFVMKPNFKKARKYLEYA